MGKYYVGEVVPITRDTFNSLMEFKNGPDSIALWIRYVIQTQYQKTDDTKSYDSFMRGAMGGWGEQRFRSAKENLKALGLLEVCAIRDESTGRISDYVTRVMFELKEPLNSEVLTWTLLHQVLVPPGPGLTRSGSSRVLKKKNKEVINKSINENSNSEDSGESTEGSPTVKEPVIEYSPTLEDFLITPVDGKVVQVVIKTIYDVLIENGLPRKKEIPLSFAKSVLNSADFKRCVWDFGDGVLLVRRIMEYAVKDQFWNWRIISVGDFYYKWATLYSQMKNKKLLTFEGKRIKSWVVDDVLNSF